MNAYLYEKFTNLNGCDVFLYRFYCRIVNNGISS